MKIRKSARYVLAVAALAMNLGAVAQTEKTVLFENFDPNGEKFSETATIDWNTQKVYAKIETAAGSVANENILSVGTQIDTWSNGSHFHFYYNYGTLKCDYLTSGSKIFANDYNGFANTTLQIEISKEKGLVVNGEARNGSDMTDPATYYSDLWNETSITVGSLEGNGRSYQHVSEISIVPAEWEPDPLDPDPEPTDTLSPTATSEVYDFSGFEDTEMLMLFKNALDQGRDYPTEAEFAAAGIQQSDIAFIRSHVRNKGILSRADRLIPETYETRNLWMNTPMNSGKDNTGGQPTGSFASDVFSMWNYTNLYGAWNHSLFTAAGAWTDAAHKNGTDMMSGIKFFDTTGGRTGGSETWVDFIVQKDDQGDYLYAEPLINIMMYFGFDGINYNWETSGYNDEDVVGFHKQLYKIAAEKGFNNFHSGIYTFSNMLTAMNADALFGGEDGRTHDLMLNYNDGDFTSSNALKMSAQAAENAMGTTDGLYTGVWIVTMDRTWTKLNSSDEAKKIGVCLWGEHSQSRFWSYNTGANNYEQQTNYQALLERAWSGGNRNPLLRPEVSNTGNNWEQEGDKKPLQTFAGLATWIPERSSIMGNLPFATGFNLGNGDRYSYKGKRTAGQWYNMAAQDIVPTYRWLVVVPQTQTASTDIQPEFTSLDQYTGGTSLLLTGKATTAGTDIVLYKTDLNVSAGNPYAKLAVKSGKEGTNPSNLYLILKKSDDTWVETPYGDVSGSTWEEKQIALTGVSQGDVIKAIGLRVKGSDDNYKLYVGKLEINDDIVATPASITDLNAEVKEETKSSLSAKLWWNTTASAQSRANWDLVYNDEANIDHFEILYKNGEEGRVSEIGRTSQWSAFVPNILFESENDDPYIGVRAVSTDLKNYSPIEWIRIPRAAQDSLPTRRDDSYGISQIDPSADGYEVACQLRYVTDATTTGADQDLAFHNGGPVEDGTNYRDATDHVLKVHQGQTFQLWIKPYDTSNLPSHDGLRFCFGRGWIDLNGDHQFDPNDITEDPANGECLFTVGELRKGHPEMETDGITVNVTIPEDARTGKSRMRIVFADAWFAGTLMPTGLTSKGFTIDFGVEITGDNAERPMPVDDHDQGEADEPENLNGVPSSVVNIDGKVSTVSVGDNTIDFQNVDKAWIYTASGMLARYLNAPKSIDKASLGRGVYLVKMQSGNILRTQKVVIR